MPKIALVTARAARGLDEDLPPLEAALKKAGADAQVVDWDDVDVNWSQFDLALLRSTWDYVTRLQEFLAWAERVAQATKLLNPPPIVRWNTDKHYLATLAGAGVPIIPSEFAEPGMDAERAVTAFLQKHAPKEFEVKPAVGAGSKDVFRYRLAEQPAAIAHASTLLADRRSIVLQPYLDSVDQSGETALMFFAGRFSHAIRKAPILSREQRPVEALFAAERITPRTPGVDELTVGEQAVAAIPFERPLYARVDLIRDATGAPRVLELELTEPSVFLDHAPGSADRFAQTILSRSELFLRRLVD